VVDLAREEGYSVGLLRPISLYPFPKEPLRELALDGKLLLTVEMSCGQMVEDVRLSTCGLTEVHFYGRTGGVVPDQLQVLDQIRGILPRLVGGRFQRAEVAK
jgi:2-oxoglutarate ferredoxin oxidoreductase subunit alpha